MIYLTYINNYLQLDIAKELNINEVIIINNELIKKDISNIKKWFLLDILPFNSDIEKLLEKLLLLEENNFYGVIIQDISILNIIDENNINLKVILDSSTGGNNIEFYKFFSSLNRVESIFLSRELKISNILNYLNYKINFSLQVYGLLKIFNTKRKLISNLRESKNLKISNKIYLKEPKRKNELFTLVESDCGTIMYNSKIISAYENLELLEKHDNLRAVIDLRHLEDIKNYKIILNYFINKNTDEKLFELENFPIVSIGREFEKDEETVKYFREAGLILDVKKNSYIILKSNFNLEQDINLFLINDKKKEIKLNLNNIKKLDSDIYYISWQRGVISNVKFYFY